jgi:hypothetical protein
MSNRNLILISGESVAGKTVSLRNLEDPKGVMYLNCESGKELPFKSDFRQQVITDPLLIPQILDACDESDKCHTVVIDSLTYMMDMYESLYVLTATADNKFKAWSDYAQFFKNLMQKHIAQSSLNVIFLAHTSDVFNESEHIQAKMVKVKGSLMNQGIESYFNIVIGAKKMVLTAIPETKTPLLNITEEEEMVGFKYVYQTRLTRNTTNERIRGPMGMWSVDETFIDNDLQLAVEKLHDYYSD